MKIGIKCHSETYNCINKEHLMRHVSGYWNFLHKRIWEKQGHEVKFVDEKAQGDSIVTDYNNFDIIFFRGLNSLRNEEFIIKLLNEFKGKKILYLEAYREKEWLSKFDYVFIPEIDRLYNIWKENYPNNNINKIAWTHPETELLDKNIENPYTTKTNIIFTGVYNDRYLNSMRFLANKGLNIYLGGLYNDGKFCRATTKEEINHDNIRLLTNEGVFAFGSIYNYIRHADVALGYYPANFEGALSSKIVEYLSLGCPIVAEHTIPNRYRIIECDAGTITNYDNQNELYQNIKKELDINRNRNIIINKARGIFNPDNICTQIIQKARV